MSTKLLWCVVVNLCKAVDSAAAGKDFSNAMKKCCVIVSVCVVRMTEQLAAVPRLANLGPLFKSSHSPVELTESETEYIVRCIKHTFPHHIVFQVHSLALLSLAVISSRYTA